MSKKRWNYVQCIRDLCYLEKKFPIFGKPKEKKRNALILIYFRGSIVTFMECLLCFHTEIIDLLNKCKCDNPGDQIEYIFLNREPSELCLPKWLLFILIDIFQLCEVNYWLMVKLGVEIVKCKYINIDCSLCSLNRIRL